MIINVTICITSIMIHQDIITMILIIYITIIINGGLKGTLIALPIWAVISLVQVLVSIFLISDKKVINN